MNVNGATTPVSYSGFCAELTPAMSIILGYTNPCETLHLLRLAYAMCENPLQFRRVTKTVFRRRCYVFHLKQCPCTKVERHSIPNARLVAEQRPIASSSPACVPRQAQACYQTKDTLGVRIPTPNARSDLPRISPSLVRSTVHDLVERCRSSNDDDDDDRMTGTPSSALPPELSSKSPKAQSPTSHHTRSLWSESLPPMTRMGRGGER